MMPAQKPGRSKQNYRTPPEFLAAVRNLLKIYSFDIDLAADYDNAVVLRHYDENMNSLAHPWKVGDGWNWLNPPYANIGPWVKRAYEQGCDGAQTAVLVPAGVGANWWRDWVHEKATALFLNGRLSFDGKAPYPKDCALLLYTNNYTDNGPAAKYYRVWDWRKDIPIW